MTTGVFLWAARRSWQRPLDPVGASVGAWGVLLCLWKGLGMLFGACCRAVGRILDDFGWLV
eukprot:555304-Alexandrium_andersonii.AAC.1